MAPNKKKKKAASNPARGFATTSLPSKAKPVDEPERNVVRPSVRGQEQGATGEPSVVPNGQGTDVGTNGQQSTKIEDMTPEELEAHLENSELEALVDKYSARCIADANRQITRLETERRQLRLQANKLSTYPWLPEETIDELLEMNAAGTATNGHNGNISIAPGAEEIALVDLWTLQRVLQALQLPRVSDAIHYIAGLAASGQLKTNTDLFPGLPEALQWYAMNNEGAELPSYEHVVGSRPGKSGDSTPVQDDSGTFVMMHSYLIWVHLWPTNSIHRRASISRSEIYIAHFLAMIMTGILATTTVLNVFSQDISD